MIIAFGAYTALASIDAFHGAFDEFTYEYGDPSDVREFEETRQTFESGTAYAGAAVAVVVIVDIVALILAFVMTKDRKQVKIVGIVLIIIAFVNLIAISAFGIIGFILILVAGIVALRWKPVGYEPTYTSSGAISRK
jgi:hypothetical protein